MADNNDHDWLKDLDPDLGKIQQFEPCIYSMAPDHNVEAQWYLVADSGCEHAPARTPMCHDCKHVVAEYVIMFGQTGWMCAHCGHVANVLDVQPRH